MLIKREVSDEIERQLEVWAGAYRNIDALNEQVASLDINRGILVERIEAETKIKEESERTINSLIEDVDDNDENGAEIRALLEKHISSVVVEGFVR